MLNSPATPRRLSWCRIPSLIQSNSLPLKQMGTFRGDNADACPLVSFGPAQRSGVPGCTPGHGWPAREALGKTVP
jgi:hypothetical protein